MPSIAILGAGPKLGLAIARTFGSHGYDVALIARNRAKLDALVEQLSSDGHHRSCVPRRRARPPGADACDRRCGQPASGASTCSSTRPPERRKPRR